MSRALALAMLFVASFAHAQEATPSLDHGIQLFEKGDLDGAEAELEGVYAAHPGPDEAYALGQVLRRKGRCDKAIDYFRRAVAQSPSDNFSRAANYQIGRCVVENPSLAPQAPPQPSRPPQQPPPTPRPARKWYRDPAGGALFGVGLASAVAGTALLARAQVEASDSRDNLSDYREAGNVTALRIAGAVTLGVGGALAIGGIIRWAVVAAHRH